MILFNNLGSITDLKTGRSFSAAQLLDKIRCRVATLTRNGVKRGDRLIIAHGGTPDFFADLLAVWTLNACAVCLNPQLTAGEMETVADFVKPAAILISDPNPAVSSSLAPIIETSVDHKEKVKLPRQLWTYPEDPALILFTSGTTGNPKGVVHTGHSLGARMDLNRQHLGERALLNPLCVLPTHFGHGLIGNCLTPLVAGGHLHLYTNPGLSGASQLGDLLTEHNISFMSGVPSFWKMAIKASSPPARRTLEQVSIGSAPLSVELWQAVIKWSGALKVCNMYGITETANWAAGASSSDLPPEDGLVGKMWGGDAAVISDDGNLHKAGSGEIALRTASLMDGYFQRPDLSAEVLRQGWYYTGDFGSIDEQGNIRLLGRLKTEINRAGMKVLPEEIDMLLERHPDVAEACTFGVADSILGEMVAIAVRPQQGKELLKVAELRSWCEERIRSECVPEKWFIVDDIPKTDRGKINRAMVRDACQK